MNSSSRIVFADSGNVIGFKRFQNALAKREQKAIADASDLPQQLELTSVEISRRFHNRTRKPVPRETVFAPATDELRASMEHLDQVLARIKSNADMRFIFWDRKKITNGKIRILRAGILRPKRDPSHIGHEIVELISERPGSQRYERQLKAVFGPKDRGPKLP